VNLTLVDSIVLLDVLTEDPEWSAWSEGALEERAEHTVLVINPIIYAEVSAGFERKEALEESLPVEHFRRDALPWDAAFLAGKCFVQYRRRGGPRLSPLPGFYIGAHAAVVSTAASASPRSGTLPIGIPSSSFARAPARISACHARTSSVVGARRSWACCRAYDRTREVRLKPGRVRVPISQAVSSHRS
jgi:predicted nucleic acid-binding protein